MNHLTFYAKIAGSAFLRWACLSIIGLIVSLLGLDLGITLFLNNTGPGDASARVGGIISVIFTMLALFKQEFWTAFLIVASLAFIWVYAVVASKVTLSFIISQLYENKLASNIGEQLTRILRSTFDKNPHLLNSIDHFSTFKDQLLTEASTDRSVNKIQRKVIQYALKKVKLDDVDLKAGHEQLPETLSDKILEQLSEAAKPSYWLFFIAIGVHLTIALLAFIFDHH